MDDLDLDRALEKAFAVTPSPEFVARVRTKIAEAPPPSVLEAWMKPATVIACGVVLAIAAIAGLKPGTTTDNMSARAGLKPNTTNAPSATKAPVILTVPVTPTVPVVVPTFRSAAPTKARTVPAVEPFLPEVIIAPGDVEALRQFVTGASEARFVASFDQTPAPIPWAIIEPAEHNN